MDSNKQSLRSDDLKVTATHAEEEPVVTEKPVEGTGKKMNTWLIGGVIIVVLFIVGAYFFFNSQQTPTQTTTSTTAPTEVQTTQNNPVQPTVTVDALDNDLKAVNAEAPDDLSALDQDLQSL